MYLQHFAPMLLVKSKNNVNLFVSIWDDCLGCDTTEKNIMPKRSRQLVERLKRLHGKRTTPNYVNNETPDASTSCTQFTASQHMQESVAESKGGDSMSETISSDNSSINEEDEDMCDSQGGECDDGDAGDIDENLSFTKWVIQNLPGGSRPTLTDRDLKRLKMNDKSYICAKVLSIMCCTLCPSNPRKLISNVYSNDLVQVHMYEDGFDADLIEAKKVIQKMNKREYDRKRYKRRKMLSSGSYVTSTWEEDEDEVISPALDEAEGNAVNKMRIGSTILIRYNQFTSILKRITCNSCNIPLCIGKEICNGNAVGIHLTCSECKQVEIFSNTSANVTEQCPFHTMIPVSAMMCGMSYRQCKTFMSGLGITASLSRSTYFLPTTSVGSKPYNLFKEWCNNSCRRAYSNYVQCLNDRYGADWNQIPWSFDGAYSHVRNAGEGTAEAIAAITPDGYDQRPILAYSCVYKGIHNVRDGNFDGSSNQIEHANLKNVLNMLEEYHAELPDNVIGQTSKTFAVTIDGDLSSLSTLNTHKQVSAVYLDLTHKVKNARKKAEKLLPDMIKVQNIIWKHLRMYVFEAGRRKNNGEVDTPTEDELMQSLLGLYDHLLNNHTHCWANMCPYKSDPDKNIQKSSGCIAHFTQHNKDRVKAAIQSIYSVERGQKLITNLRTTENESFNNVKTLLLPKRMNFMVSYPLRYLLVIHKRNEGLQSTYRRLQEAFSLPVMSEADAINLDGYNYTDVVYQRAYNQNNELLRRQKRAEIFQQLVEDCRHQPLDIPLEQYKKGYMQTLDGEHVPVFLTEGTKYDRSTECAKCAVGVRDGSNECCIPCRFMNIRTKHDVIVCAHAVFEVSAFRDVQWECIDKLMHNMNVFLRMNTGMGKSLCFQIWGLIREGITIVVCPLLALIHDQVNRLNERGIPTAMLHGKSTFRYKRRMLYDLSTKCIKFLYVTPERFWHKSFQGLLHRIQFDLEQSIFLVIDECHTILEYSSFREGYMSFLNQFAGKKYQFQILAATATLRAADVPIVKKALGFDNFDDSQNSNVISKNVHKLKTKYEVMQLHGQMDEYVYDVLTNRFPDQCGLIYCITPSQVESLYNSLVLKGLPAVKYCGPMDPEQKEEHFLLWSSKQKRIMVCNGAFGMGVDVSHATFVIHAHLPLSMSSYIQETGRCGRNDIEATCILLWRPTHLRLCVSLGNWSDSLYMKLFVKRSLCRRISIMDWYNPTYDNLLEGICSTLGNQVVPCDICSDNTKGICTPVYDDCQHILDCISLCNDEMFPSICFDDFPKVFQMYMGKLKNVPNTLYPYRTIPKAQLPLNYNAKLTTQVQIKQHIQQLIASGVIGVKTIDTTDTQKNALQLNKKRLFVIHPAPLEEHLSKFTKIIIQDIK